MVTFSTLLLSLFPAAVILAALKDATSFTIPNWISGLLVAAFVPAALALHLSPAAMGLNAAAAFAALIVGMGMFAAGWCGGGDAKLMAAAVLWLGWQGLPSFLAMTGLAGGAVAVGLVTARKHELVGFVPGAPSWLGRLLTPGEDLPYGLAIAAGALAAFPSSALIASAG
jgi:prepilin peptidase CpaA